MTSGRLLLFLAVLAVALAQARASPLDADSCAKLQIEQTQLEFAGVEVDMAKGPEWAKTNLASGRLDQIRRFIEVEEQLLFRCRGKSLVHLPLESDPTGDGKDNDKEAAPKASTQPPGAAKKTKPPAAKKPDSAKKAAVQPPIKPTAPQTKQGPGAAKAKPPAKAAVKPAEASVQRAPASEKRAPKAKADEAGKAPLTGPAANPDQLPPPAKK